MVCWTKNQVNALIMIYKNLPSLWNVKHENYRHKSRKDVDWKSLLRDYQNVQNDDAITLGDIKNKIHVLRTQYSRELRHWKQCSRSNTEGEEICLKRRLWCFEELDFLRQCRLSATELKSKNCCYSSESFKEQEHQEVPKVKEEYEEVLHWPGLVDSILPTPTNSSNMSTPEPVESTGGTILIGTGTISTIPSSKRSVQPPPTNDILTTANTSHEAVPSTLQIKYSRYKQKKLNFATSSKEDELLQLAISKLKDINESDEFTLFGNSVGGQLRSIADRIPMQARIARKLINEVLFMADFGELDMITKVPTHESTRGTILTGLDTTSISLTSENSGLPFKRKKSNASSKEDELLRLSISKLKKEKETDEFTLFGASVGGQLRSIAGRIRKQAIIARKLINDVLFLADFRELDMISKISPGKVLNGGGAVTSTNKS